MNDTDLFRFDHLLVNGFRLDLVLRDGRPTWIVTSLALPEDGEQYTSLRTADAIAWAVAATQTRVRRDGYRMGPGDHARLHYALTHPPE